MVNCCTFILLLSVLLCACTNQNIECPAVLPLEAEMDSFTDGKLFLPEQKRPGEKYQIAVVFSGEYWEFFENLKAAVKGFSAIGWGKDITIPNTISTGYDLIKYLSQVDFSNYIAFSPQLFFDLEWGQKTMDVPAEADVILAYGGIAGQLLYDNADRYGIPILIDAVTDCFRLGLTQTVSDSGKNMVSCKIDVNQFKRQIELFHTLTGFTNLGIVYGDDEYGHTYSAVRDIKQMAEVLNFCIIEDTSVREYASDDTVPLYLSALERVARQADAVYIGASAAVTEYDNMHDISEVLVSCRVPSFALEGSKRVKEGILFGLGSSAFIRSGIYIAKKTAMVLHGILPRTLPQEFENIKTFAVNLDTAERIGFTIPFELLLGADEIYPQPVPYIQG